MSILIQNRGSAKPHFVFCGLHPTQLEPSYPRIAGVAITRDGY